MLIYQLITRKGFTYKEFFTSTRPRGQWPATGHCYEDHFVHVNQFHSLIGYMAACTSNVCFMDSIAALWRWRYPWLIPLNEPTTVVYQILHISFTTLANNHLLSLGKRIPVMAKKAKRKMLELKCIAISLTLNECVCWFGPLSWWEVVFIGNWRERLGWNLPFEEVSLSRNTTKNHNYFSTFPN